MFSSKKYQAKIVTIYADQQKRLLFAETLFIFTPYSKPKYRKAIFAKITLKDSLPNNLGRLNEN